jgi:hypothetical protein
MGAAHRILLSYVQQEAHKEKRKVDNGASRSSSAGLAAALQGPTPPYRFDIRISLAFRNPYVE